MSSEAAANEVVERSLLFRRIYWALVFMVIALLLIWAIWLIATPDSDGGRHPAGWLMLAVSGVGIALAAGALQRRKRDPL